MLRTVFVVAIFSLLCYGPFLLLLSFTFYVTDRFCCSYLFPFMLQTVVPLSQCDSHLHSAKGEIQDASPGVYILVFDNTFSRSEPIKVSELYVMFCQG